MAALLSVGITAGEGEVLQILKNSLLLARKLLPAVEFKGVGAAEPVILDPAQPVVKLFQRKSPFLYG